MQESPHTRFGRALRHPAPGHPQPSWPPKLLTASGGLSGGLGLRVLGFRVLGFRV